MAFQAKAVSNYSRAMRGPKKNPRKNQIVFYQFEELP
jgi:hypothetical protein